MAFKLHVMLLVVTLCIAVCMTQDYGRRRPGPNWPPQQQCRFGSTGMCGGFTNQRCRWDSRCRRFNPSSSAGTCCRNRPGGTRPGQGRCPRDNGMVGICVFDPARGSCLRNTDCPRRQICCSSGCGRRCMYPINNRG